MVMLQEEVITLNIRVEWVDVEIYHQKNILI